MELNNFPFLEFDNDKNSIINPETIFSSINAPEVCIYPFYKEVVNKLVNMKILKTDCI